MGHVVSSVWTVDRSQWWIRTRELAPTDQRPYQANTDGGVIFYGISVGKKEGRDPYIIYLKARAIFVFAHIPPPTLTFHNCSHLPVVRSEHVRTLFNSNQSQEYKSEVLSTWAISDWAVPELVIAGAQLVCTTLEEDDDILLWYYDYHAGS